MINFTKQFDNIETKFKEIENNLNNQSNLDDIFKEPSYDDLKVALENWLNPEADSTEGQATAEPKKEEAAPVGVNKVDDVGKAFDDLFNE